MILFELSEFDGVAGHRWGAKAFRGRSRKPYAYFTFRSEEQRERWILDEERKDLERETRHSKRVHAKKAARDELRNPYRVGDILHYSWGYDQTNCEFFQVTETSARTVTIREIAQHTVPASEGFMSDRRGPCPGKFLEGAKPMTKTLQVHVDYEGRAGEPYLPMPHGSLSKCNPEDAFYCSWYA